VSHIAEAEGASLAFNELMRGTGWWTSIVRREPVVPPPHSAGQRRGGPK
jgi:hypothetical protein